MNPYVTTEFGDNYVSVTVQRGDSRLIISVMEDGTVVTENKNGVVSQVTLEPLSEGNR